MVRIYTIPSSRRASTITSGAIASLIENVGRKQFSDKLFRMAADSIGCVHLSAFTFNRHGLPAIAFAENTGTSTVARDAGDRYVGHYWQLDPIRALSVNHDTNDGRRIFEIGADEILYADYKRDCYTAVNLGARLSIGDTRPYGMVRLNFYSTKSFASAQKTALFDVADILVPLLWRHTQASFRLAQGGEEVDFGLRLAQAAPGLSPRERSVCVLILTGLSSEGIALRLGISLNTVLTYRKRAYARLQISSQNELMRLVLR